MKKCSPAPLLFFLGLPVLLSGCGGGSGRSGDDGAISLSGNMMRLEGSGDLDYRLLFLGQDVKILREPGGIRYQGTYTYRLQGGSKSAVLDIRPVEDDQKACSMSDVLISFEDAGREEGLVISGTCTEMAQELPESIKGIPRSMAGWRCHVSGE